MMRMSVAFEGIFPIWMSNFNVKWGILKKLRIETEYKQLQEMCGGWL